MMETLNIAPDVDGLVRWLKHVYKTDEKLAVKILRSGWPSLCPADAVSVLEGWADLRDILGARAK